MAASQIPDSDKPSVSGDTASVHQLLHSVGQLKYSLTSILSLQIQTAGLSLQEMRSSQEKTFNQDSNRILEKILDEVVAQRPLQMKASDGSIPLSINETCSQVSDKHLLSVKELETVLGELYKELLKIRKMYLALL